MSQFSRMFIAVGVTTVAALFACDSSPTGPTGSTGSMSASPVGSNRILGSFDGGTSVASRQTARANTSFEGIRVTVRQNQEISVEVRSNGTFELDDVPVGRVTILFIRDGVQIGEVDIRGVTAIEEIRVTLELTGNDSVILIDLQRSVENDSSDDNSSAAAGLKLELDPDNFCPEWANGGTTDDPVFATIKGDLIDEVDLGSIMMAGPTGQTPPASVELKADRIEVTFDNAAAIGIVDGVAEGDSVEIRITGKFMDGTSWELTETIRIKCEDDDSSDDNSSDDNSSDDNSSS